MDNKFAPIISIVTPFYSRPELIKDGLDSIYSQGLDNDVFEVIAVNNGAKDIAVQESLDSYKYKGKRPENLRIVNVNVNKRAGSGRNAGIRSARGLFILHKDHDDVFVPGALLKIVNEIKKTPHLDLLVFDYEERLYDDKSLIISCPHASNSQDIMDGDSYLIQQKVPSFIWHTAYKREFVLKNNLFVVEDVLIEDTDYILSCIIPAKFVKYVPIVGLTYYKFGAKGSNVTSCVASNYTTSYVTGIIELFERVFDKGHDALLSNHPGGRTLKNIYHFYYKDSLTKQIWQLPYKDIVELIKKHPLKEKSKYKISNFASNNPRKYALIACMICPFYRSLLKAYRRIKGIRY